MDCIHLDNYIAARETLKAHDNLSTGTILVADEDIFNSVGSSTAVTEKNGVRATLTNASKYPIRLRCGGGQRTLRIDARDNRTSYVYDVKDHVRRILYPDGTRVTLGWNRYDRPSEVEDSTGCTTMIYDAMKRPSLFTFPPNKELEWDYDGEGQRTKLTDPDAGRFTYAYDNAGRPGPVRKVPASAAISGVELSVIITAHNEGEEVERTVRSVQASTRCKCEILLVDDGSTDGSCQGLEGDNVRLIRHEERVGVAYSRNDACGMAGGKVLAFLDGHQRLEDGCFERCAELACAENAIVWPDVRGLEDRGWVGHGARFRLGTSHGYFGVRWINRRPRKEVTRIETLVVPGYVMPRSIYERVRWIEELRGWGGSEPAITLKAFFLGIPILHLCGPLARHLFRSSNPYSTPWESVWRNHALVARVCFDERTWCEHWLPEVFEKRLSPQARQDLESDAVLAEHMTFQQAKVRPDRDFWEQILHQEPPRCLKT